MQRDWTRMMPVFTLCGWTCMNNCYDMKSAGDAIKPNPCTKQGLSQQVQT
jgi:hypothetical protein